MWNEIQKEALLNVCKKHRFQNSGNVIVPEPYLPYKPEKWNGILVLAESQNISPGDEYDKWLNEHKTEPRKLMTRLEQIPYKNKPDWIGVGPWDNLTIQLALQAIFEGAKLSLKLKDVAVSNAVPWTKKRSGSENERPDKEMRHKAKSFWENIFDVWNPDIKVLIVLGNIAEEVMNAPGIKEKYKKNQLKLPSPSRRNISRESGKFDYSDIGKKFPMVQGALETLKISKDVKYYKNKVFFACHAVSCGVPKFTDWFGGVRNL